MNVSKHSSSFCGRNITTQSKSLQILQCAPMYLKITATDNTDQYGQGATEVVRSNFYVDDLLRSSDPKTATILVKNIVDMCSIGGFHLTKFISNNRELLMSISEDQRRNGVKNADLISDLPTEKALSIQWNIPDDSFFFSTYR